MIIFGSRGRIVKKAEGNFYCPNCREDREYQKKRSASYFTLFFIPLFQIRNHGEFIECQHCKSKYQPGILEYSREELDALSKPWVCSNCNNSNPSEYLECLNCGQARAN